MATSTTVFAAKDAGFSSTVNRMQGTLAGFQSGLASFAVKAAGLVAVFVGVRSAVQAFGSAIDMGGKLNDLSARTGETAGNLAILQRAFENAGAGAESVGPTINRLQRAIVEAGEGGKEQAEAFGKLGLNLDRLKDLTPTQQLQAVAGAIQNVGNDSERTQLAMALLGRSGGELIPLLRAMGVELETAKKQLGGAPAILDRTSQHLDTVGDNFKAIGEKGTEFMLGFMEKLAPILAEVTTRLANIDAAGFGAKLSEYAAKTVNWVAETFKLGEALNQIDLAIKAITSGEFSDGLSLMFMTARNTALNAINEVAAMAMAAVQSVVKFLSTTMGADSGLMRMLVRGFDYVAASFRQSMSHGLADILALIPGIGERAASAMRGLASDAYREAEVAKGALSSAAEIVAMDFAEAAKAFPETFAASYAANAANPLIEMRDRLAEAEALAAGIASNIAAAGGAAATVDPKVAGATETAGERIAREEAEAREKSGKSGSGGGSSRGKGSGSAMTFNERVAEMQGNARAQRDEELAARYEAGGFMRSAVRAQDRAQRRQDEAMDRGRMKDHLSAMGFNNMGEAFSQYQRDVPMGERMSESEFKAFQKQMIEQGKTPEERARAEEEARGKHAGGGGKSDLEIHVADVLKLLRDNIPAINEKLPQTALVYS